MSIQPSTSNQSSDVSDKVLTNGVSNKLFKSKSIVSVESSLSSSKPINMTSEEVYYLAREFVKAKEGSKALHLSYHDRNMLNVLTKQINSRKLENEENKVGFLDLVGKDRIQLWKSLGDLSKEDAMKKYVNLIQDSCPLFHAYFEAHKRHLEEVEEKKLKLIDEEEQLRKEMTEQKEKKLREEDLKQNEENKRRREEIQRKQIQEALNQQTFPHFKTYAEQQHPNNSQAQEELIKQLQEQHFEQYMNQVYQQQLVHQQQQAEQLKAMKRAQKRNDTSSSQSPDNEDQFKKLSLNDTKNETNQTILPNNFPIQNSLSESYQSINHNNNSSSAVNLSEVNLNMSDPDEAQVEAPQETLKDKNQFGQIAFDNKEENQENEVDDDDDDEAELPPISAASMLTRKDIKEFKESVRKDNDAIIKVGSGETVTVRVPTHEDGRLIFWEFSTDFYDLGFGLYFEWTLSPSNNVTVHVSDSSDEDEGEDDESGKQDIEVGDKVTENKPPCDEIIPIFRRDCHEEVYAGSHLYPGRGVYLLKFDNSYSLWRSKTLYYRVYYSK